MFFFQKYQLVPRSSKNLPFLFSENPIQNEISSIDANRLISTLKQNYIVGGWTSPSEKILVKLDHVPKNRGENKKLWNHHPEKCWCHSAKQMANIHWVLLLSHIPIIQKGNLTSHRRDDTDIRRLRYLQLPGSSTYKGGTGVVFFWIGKLDEPQEICENESK